MQSPGKLKSKAGFRLAWVGLAMGVVAAATVVHGQRVVEGKGFKFVEYFDPPHETQMKSQLEGAKAVPQPGNRLFLISDARLQTFEENGKGGMIVEAPECLYDATARAVSSDGPLRLRSADGQFYLEGEGFLYQQTNSSLFVSNKVHTIVHGALLNGQPAARTNETAGTPETIDIFSDRFDYVLSSGQGVYRGNVHVAGTNLSLTGGTLTVDVPMENRHLQKLVATEDVVLDYVLGHTKTQAKGQRVTYDADKDVMHVSGQPTWRADLREGRGDELLLDHKNEVFESAGNAWLKMPSQGAGGGGFLPRPNVGTSAPTASTNQWVEIFSDRYVIRTNSAVFSDNVRVTDSRDDKLEGKMSCALLTATFAGTNELRDLIAETNVVIESETNRMTAGRAVYTGTNGMMELRQNPRWTAGTRDGWGDLILVNVPKNEMQVYTNAVMRLPAEELGKSTMAGAPGPKKVTSTVMSNQFTVITCDEYVVGPEAGQFRRDVHLEHPQMKMDTKLVNVTMPKATGEKIPRIVAEQSVAFDLIDDRGQKVHGTGNQAVYTYNQTATATNELMELTGTPAVVTASTNMVGKNSVILLNLTRHTVMAPGRYNIVGVVTSESGTNGAVTPLDVLKR